MFNLKLLNLILLFDFHSRIPESLASNWIRKLKILNRKRAQNREPEQFGNLIFEKLSIESKAICSWNDLY